LPNIFWTADTHFGHAGILRHQPERSALFGCDVAAMDAAIINGINEHVWPNDELWILGDFAWKASKYGHYRQRIKCRKIHVVTGNHDSSSLRSHVSSMNNMVYRKFGKQKIHMSHYPLASWRAREHGSIHLYGHCHGSMEEILNRIWPGRRAIDVGMDNAYRLFGEWRPFSLDEILGRFL
jgi:calcineurin-like phosphoesterase family protein